MTSNTKQMKPLERKGLLTHHEEMAPSLPKLFIGMEANLLRNRQVWNAHLLHATTRTIMIQLQIDPWKIHIVHGTGDPEHQHGKWIIKGTYRRADHDNISALWQCFKDKVKEGEIPAIRMECPSQPQNTDPEIHNYLHC